MESTVPGANRTQPRLVQLARSVETHTGVLSAEQQMKYTIDDFETKLLESDLADEEEE